MKKWLILLCLSLLILFIPPLLCAAPIVEVDIIHSQDRYPAGGSYPILLKLKIAKDWYIHCPDDDEEGLIPTEIDFESTAFYRFIEIHFPEPTKKKFAFTSRPIIEIHFPEPTKKKFAFTSRPIEVYGGDIFVRAKVLLDPKLPPGNLNMTGHLSYQACNDDSCLPPEKINLQIPLSIVSPGTTTKLLNKDLFSSMDEEKVGQGKPAKESNASRLSEAGFLTALFIFFGVGLGLNLTPCVYPLIPITVSYFSGRKQGNWGERILHGCFYILGISITNSILGVSAALTGNMMGSLLQKPLVVIFIAGVMFFLALSFFGLWELRLPTGITKAASKNFSGFAGTIFMGLTMGILAAPCLGPAILSMITFVAQKGDPFFGFICFFVMSVGLGIPLALLGIFSGAIEKLPASGDWMIWVRKLMGWILIGVGAYYLSLLIPEKSIRLLLFGGVLAMAAIHLGWWDKSGKDRPKFLTFKKTVGVIVLLTGIGFFYYGLNYTGTSHEKSGWVSFEDSLIDQAAKENKPLLIDFSAEWCYPCKIMEKDVFQTNEFNTLRQQFIISKVDLTRQGRKQADLIRRFNIRGVPTIIFYNRQGQEIRELRLEHYEGKKEFLKRMEKALQN
jgi:thiol:disulfide interchange protein DsbD